MSHPSLTWSRRRWLTAAGGFGASLASAPLWAQDARWPSKAVKLVVGFPAGTGPDLLARMLAEPLAREFGQPFIVENRAGASGNIAASVVAKASDGYTFGIVGAAVLTSAPLLYPTLNFKASDFAPITVIGSAPQVLVTTPKIAFASVQAFLAEARQAGNRWSYGSPGMGSNSHLSVELLKEKTGIEAVHVPFGGIPAVLTAMIGGDIQMAVVPIGSALPHMQAGRLKAVGLATQAPSPLAPGVPTLAEGGVKDLQLDVWNAVMASAHTPAAIVARFGEAVRKIIRSEELQKKLFEQGWVAGGGSAQELEQRIAQDAAMYGRIVTARGIRLEN
jgi:tripartite-type tricarboxylate transporter receptor subunit TctC